MLRRCRIRSSDWRGGAGRTCSQEVGRSAFSTMQNTPNTPKHPRKKTAFSPLSLVALVTQGKTFAQGQGN
jgi:hypothetical protein